MSRKLSLDIAFARASADQASVELSRSTMSSSANMERGDDEGHSEDRETHISGEGDLLAKLAIV